VPYCALDCSSWRAHNPGKHCRSTVSARPFPPNLPFAAVMNSLFSYVASLVTIHSKPAPFKPVSVNYFPHRCAFIVQIGRKSLRLHYRVCNYSCKFCFHTSKNRDILSLDEAKRGLRQLAEAGMRKLNISGGEPFLEPTFVGEIFKYCKTELKLESCSVVNNGSKVTREWLDEYGQYLDIMAISCDSFKHEVNQVHGRGKGGEATEHVSRVFRVAEWCRQQNIMVKINSVITM
jgi:radical S-adenosyl methionine domain-containing protein 2